MAKRKEDRNATLIEAQKYRQRAIDLSDPDDALLRYRLTGASKPSKRERKNK